MENFVQPLLSKNKDIQGDEEVQLLRNENKITMEDEVVSSTMTRTDDASESTSSNSRHKCKLVKNSTKRGQRQHGNSSRYKGVVPQPNGHWGAQIYNDHRRIWLGTFKTEEAAASAYDSAAIKIRPVNCNDHHRNLEITKDTANEPAFQDQYSLEQVLNMINDGSYHTKFNEFLCSLLSQRNNGGQTSAHNSQGIKEGYFYQELFRKELTPSDVGKLNRLVIPKRYAIKFFATNDNIGDAEDSGGDTKLTFYDRLMKGWNFRYCYWKSSQSYVFTRGWNKFVKEKNLKAKDTVVFYRCELRDSNGNVVKNFCMIDISVFNGASVSANNNGGVNQANISKGKGIRLFGVQIG